MGFQSRKDNHLYGNVSFQAIVEKADTKVPFILERRPPAENTVTTILDEGCEAQA